MNEKMKSQLSFALNSQREHGYNQTRALLKIVLNRKDSEAQ